jgi:hypothetical protein
LLFFFGLCRSAVQVQRKTLCDRIEKVKVWHRVRHRCRVPMGSVRHADHPIITTFFPVSFGKILIFEPKVFDGVFFCRE